MSQTFTAIPQRNNGDEITADWFNILQAAGENLENIVGLSGQTFTLANNQSSPADLLLLSFAGSVFRSFEIKYNIYFNSTGSGATEVSEVGSFIGVYNTVAGTWVLTYGPIGGNPVPTGVLFSITNAGQVQYTSPNFTGTLAEFKLSLSITTTAV